MSSKGKKDSVIVLDGIIKECHPSANFLVEFSNGSKMHAYLSGKMRKNYIRVLPGDSVKVEFSHYDLSRGRITHRYKSKPGVGKEDRDFVSDGTTEKIKEIGVIGSTDKSAEVSEAKK